MKFKYRDRVKIIRGFYEGSVGRVIEFDEFAVSRDRFPLYEVIINTMGKIHQTKIVSIGENLLEKII